MINIISENGKVGDSPLLSIGVLTYPARKVMYEQLIAMIKSDSARYADNVEILGIHDDKTASIGEKRNAFMRAAKGKYLLQIDDDDSLVPDYFDEVMPVLMGEIPDCIGHLISVEMWRDKNKFMDGLARVSMEYSGFNTHDSGKYSHTQGIYYKVPIKAEICRKEWFKNMNYGEDSEWMKRIEKHIGSQYFINQVLYKYQYRTTRHESHNERYGIS